MLFQGRRVTKVIEVFLRELQDLMELMGHFCDILQHGMVQATFKSCFLFFFFVFF